MAYSWLSAKGLLLLQPRRLYGHGIKLGSVTCKPSTLPTVLFLQPYYLKFLTNIVFCDYIFGCLHCDNTQLEKRVLLSVLSVSFVIVVILIFKLSSTWELAWALKKSQCLGVRAKVKLVEHFLASSRSGFDS